MSPAAGIHASVLLGGVHGADQRRQTAGSRPGRPGGKGQQIFPAAGTVGHGSRRGQVPGAGEKLFDKGRHRQGAGQTAEGLQVIQEGPEPFRVPLAHRRIQAAPGHLAPQTHQVIGTTVIQGTEQYRRQFHILGGVVDDAQQRREGPHMGCIQQVGGGIRKDRDARRPQGSLVYGEIPAAA